MVVKKEDPRLSDDADSSNSSDGDGGESDGDTNSDSGSARGSSRDSASSVSTLDDDMLEFLHDIFEPESEKRSESVVSDGLAWSLY